jgi:tetratricopeptide (TPR) repeat protein
MAGWRLLLLPRPHRVVSKEKPKAIDDVCTQRETPNVERTGYLAPARKQRWPLTIWIASAIVGIGAGIFFLINLDARKQLAPYVLATELKPHDFRAWLALARECHGLKRYSQAEEACKTALKLHPDDSSAFLFLGRIYRDQGRMSEAIYCYSQAQDGYAYSELGDLYTKMGQFENANSRHGMAIAYWKRETESDHAFWLTWENLGDAYLKNEQRANARAAYETAVRLSPNTAHLREKLQKLGGAN